MVSDILLEPPELRKDPETVAKNDGQSADRRAEMFAWCGFPVTRWVQHLTDSCGLQAYLESPGVFAGRRR